MIIRQVKLEDVEQLTCVHICSSQSAYKGLIPSSVLENINYQERNDMWRRAIRQSPSETVVVEKDSKVVGFANFGSCRDDGIRAGEIRAIYLLPGYWRKGIGSELLVHAEGYLKNDYEAIILWVLNTNRNAIAFYEGHGFLQDGIEKEESLWGTVVQEIRMSRAINTRS